MTKKWRQKLIYQSTFNEAKKTIFCEGWEPDFNKINVFIAKKKILEIQSKLMLRPLFAHHIYGQQVFLRNLTYQNKNKRKSMFAI